MTQYAIIRTGGKQYRAQPGGQLTIERIGGEAGSTLTFDEVLLVRDEARLEIGAPLVPGARVHATVVQQTRDAKVLIHKHKKRKKYRVTRGHRQYITRVRIDSIEAGIEAGPEPIDAGPEPIDAGPEPIDAGTESPEAGTESIEAGGTAAAPAAPPPTPLAGQVQE